LRPALQLQARLRRPREPRAAPLRRRAAAAALTRPGRPLPGGRSPLVRRRSARREQIAGFNVSSCEEAGVCPGGWRPRRVARRSGETSGGPGSVQRIKGSARRVTAARRGR